MNVLAFMCLTLPSADERWNYAAEAGQRSDLFFVSLPLGDTPPADLEVGIKWTGVRRHFAQLRYGAADSTRIAVAVDERADGSADVYVDADRTRRLGLEMKLPKPGPTWTMTLTAGAGANEAERTVLLHWGPKAKVLGLATLGGVEGTARLGGREVRCRVVDADGNGLFSDPKDVLRIDLDGDGKFNLFAEQYRLRPLLTFGKERWVVRGRPLDGAVSFAPLAGLGTIRLDLPPALAKAESVVVQMTSTDGVSVALEKNMKVEAPPGKYSVVAVNFTLPAKDGKRWKYAFYKDWAGKPPEFDVAVGKETKLDPLGKLEFTLTAREDLERLRSGQEIQLQPSWKSSTGLQVNTVFWGDQNEESSQPHAAVELSRAGGKVIGRHRSGFF
jgi:hypothetical protein